MRREHLQMVVRACGVAIACLTAMPGRAEVLFDNLNAPQPNGSVNFSNTQWGAQKFMTTTSGTSLSLVSLRLWNPNSTTGGFGIEVWDATGPSGAPGSPVGNAIYAGLAGNLSNDSSNILTVSNLSFALQPNTAYFLVALGTSLDDQPGGFGPQPGTLAWNMTDTSPSGAFDGNSSGWAGPVSQNFYMKVEAVPEPSTVAMALAGLACGGSSLFRRRRVR